MSVLGFGDFLLPRKGVDLAKWSVVACDQYTSAPAYWEKLDASVGSSPSALRLICPEAFLAEADKRLPALNAAAEDYAQNFLETHRGGVLVKRSLAGGDRWGLVCLLDLEAYSYAAGNSAPVRATEGTVTERIPPRLAVRRASRLDVPHVLCLIDDARQTVIEPLASRSAALDKLYDFELPGGGGRIEGWAVTDTAPVSAALEVLRKQATNENKPFVLVGDGNHSLASAKALYEEYKAAGDSRAAKARYALVEVENLRSDGVVFHPIHRIMYNAVGFADFIARESTGETTHVMFVGGEKRELRTLSSEIGTYRVVQALIDKYLGEHPEATVDYIHGDDDLRRLCAKRGAVGVMMPTVSKAEFFAYISANGTLPRKSFSMGEAYEKRYYLECRDLGDAPPLRAITKSTMHNAECTIADKTYIL